MDLICADGKRDGSKVLGIKFMQITFKKNNNNQGKFDNKYNGNNSNIKLLNLNNKKFIIKKMRNI